mmetsp:Transcript_12944/g.28370  ORF Transcript_12944/g.28370 Transcript_12944/m.28370 type:complete len:217 (-) Transcript_12944:886-1536(-)
MHVVAVTRIVGTRVAAGDCSDHWEDDGGIAAYCVEEIPAFDLAVVIDTSRHFQHHIEDSMDQWTFHVDHGMRREDSKDSFETMHHFDDDKLDDFADAVYDEGVETNHSCSCLDDDTSSLSGAADTMDYRREEETFLPPCNHHTLDTHAVVVAGENSERKAEYVLLADGAQRNERVTCSHCAPLMWQLHSSRLTRSSTLDSYLLVGSVCFQFHPDKH